MKKIILSLVLVTIFSLTMMFSHYVYADTYTQKLIDSSGGSGVVVDSSDNVYINEFQNHVVAKYDSNGKFVTKWGTGSGAIYGLGIDSSGNIYAIDYQYPNYRIQKFDSNGNPLAVWGTNGSQNGQFNDPLGVAIDKSGNIYVADTGNHRIQKLDSNGNFVTAWTLSKTTFGQLYTPRGIAVDSLGNVYTGDTAYNGGIQKFDSNGNPLAAWGSLYGVVGTFPDITIDSHNIIYTDGEKFDLNGTALGSIPAAGGQGIAIDSKGNLYYGGGYESVINHSPVSNNQTIIINEGAPTSIHLNATDQDNDKITFYIKSKPTHGILSGTNCPYSSCYPVVVNNLVYTPYSYFVGQDSFTFLANDGIQDGNIGTVSITVNRIDHPPTAISSVGSVNENTLLQIVLTGNDIDNNTITYALGTNPLHGTLGGFNSATGSVIYTPNRDYVGNDNFTFTTSNRSFHSNIGTFTLTVNPISYTPTAIVGSDQTVSAGSTVSLDGSGSIDPYYDIIMKNYNFGQKQPIGNFLKYSWTQTGGMPVTLSSKTISNPIFVAPLTPSGIILTFTLTVTDQSSNTSSPVTITIQPSSQPVQNTTNTTQLQNQTNHSLQNNTSQQTMLQQATSNIPSWVKGNAKYWHDGALGDDEFEKGIKYMIDNKIIKTDQKTQTNTGLKSIPKWIKSDAGWWADGTISQDEFLKGIEYLVEKGIINVQ